MTAGERNQADTLTHLITDATRAEYRVAEATHALHDAQDHLDQMLARVTEALEHWTPR
jgi:hypothetical protein